MTAGSNGPAGPPDGTYTAVLDRYEGASAVFVIEGDGQDIDEVGVERDALPEAARAVDSVVELTLEQGVATEAEHQPDETSARAEDTQSRFDRLSRRRGADDDPEPS